MEVKIKVSPSRPPNYEAIAAVFPVIRRKPGVIFTYGDTVYNPGRASLSNALLAHEAVHSQRQGDKPEDWWQQYLVDKSFRLNEELLAHRIEYISATEGYGRPQRRRMLRAIAERLSGPIYGRLLTLSEAKKLVCSSEEAEHDV